ncbi:tetratricopeptide repeat protein [Marinicella sp. S1101]|uniref:tetratricopeptide repeat protein n=1 Tax=Marinicella marina TaxID=2996016 RepID=UPI002260FEF3|nr:tetratricopeptide repeat protein [Marinicella marina]MCX7552544.1 tetratricopeptide repeat protein [Marinicella marina]MDJ1139420.1 tetratricopeptide repeat protein [Marinicella marina]
MKKKLLLLFILFINVNALAVTLEQQKIVTNALATNDWDMAMDLAEDLVDDFPKSSTAHYLLASAIRVKMQDVSQVRAMFSLGDYKEALATAIELDPQNVDARTEEIGFYMVAPGVAGGDKELAAEKIKALKVVDQLKGLEMEAQLAAVNQDPVKAKAVLEELVLLKPDSPGALMQLAVMAMQQNDYLKADGYLLKINAEEDAGWPLMAQYQRAKARVLAKQDSDTAIALLQSYQQSFSIVDTDLNLPDTAAVYWRMALAHENKGEQVKAVDLLKQSIKLDGDFKPAQNDLKRLSD